MLLHARGNGKHIGVEDDVVRIESGLFGQQTVSTGADLYLALVGIGLPLLVKCHHHYGCSQTAYFPGMGQEYILALFQRNGVDDRLALQAFQSGTDDIPLRGVYHDRHTGYIRLGSNEVKERGHLGTGIEKPVVHINVYHLRTILHLAACDADGFFIVMLFYQPQELARTGHVATLTNVDEVGFGLHGQPFQSRQPQA